MKRAHPKKVITQDGTVIRCGISRPAGVLEPLRSDIVDRAVDAARRILRDL